MSQLLGEVLPPAALKELAPPVIDEAAGQCFVVVTVDPDGTPRPCLLSVGEMRAVSERAIRIAVWPDSATTANLRRSSTVLLVVAAPPDAFHVIAEPRELPTLPDIALARFELTVTSVSVDGHDGAPVSRPMEFRATAAFGPELLASWWAQAAAIAAD